MQQYLNKVTINRDDNNFLTIDIDRFVEDKLSLYWTTEANKITKNKTFIQDVIGKSESIHFKDPLDKKQRIYFILQSNRYGAYLFAERTLQLEGMTNLRDYGGYIGAKGKRVKWGQLYRSNHLYDLPPSTLSYLKKLNIRTIIDFRSDNEIKKSPNEFIGEASTFNLDASAYTAELAAQFSASPDNENQALIQGVYQNIAADRINGDGIQVLEQYQNFVLLEKSQQTFRQMITLLLNKNNSPSLQHCRGGKDRTGYGVMLILIMLGVSKEDIINDYMLTKKNRLTRNEDKMNQYRLLTQDENLLSYLLSLIDTREEFILSSLNAMEQLCGSHENYIKKVLGFSDRDFEIMQQNYLE